MRQRKLNKILIGTFELVLLAALASACGVKGKPLPPEPPIVMKRDKWVEPEKAKKEKKDDEENPAKKNQ